MSGFGCSTWFGCCCVPSSGGGGGGAVDSVMDTSGGQIIAPTTGAVVVDTAALFSQTPNTIYVSANTGSSLVATGQQEAPFVDVDSALALAYTLTSPAAIVVDGGTIPPFTVDSTQLQAPLVIRSAGGGYGRGSFEGQVSVAGFTFLVGGPIVRVEGMELTAAVTTDAGAGFLNLELVNCNGQFSDASGLVQVNATAGGRVTYEGCTLRNNGGPVVVHTSATASIAHRFNLESALIGAGIMQDVAGGACVYQFGPGVEVASFGSFGDPASGQIVFDGFPNVFALVTQTLVTGSVDARAVYLRSGTVDPVFQIDGAASAAVGPVVAAGSDGSAPTLASANRLVDLASTGTITRPYIATTDNIRNASGVAGESLSEALDNAAGGGGGSGAPLTDANRDMPANLVTGDGQLATASGLALEPEGALFVYVSGLETQLGDGTTNAPCYLSGDGGATARSFGAFQVGDELYWNASIANYPLSTSDRITFVYEAPPP